jgi:murein DD-endopeptidase MepM/ murein hydrolase activator NlpD
VKKKSLIYLSAAIAVLLLTFSCPGCSGISNAVTSVADAITKPTAREVYKREFKENMMLYEAWVEAYNSALKDSLNISLPYGEKGTFNPLKEAAYSYNLNLQEGEVLVAEVIKDSSQRVFIDLFQDNKNEKRSELNQHRLEYAIQSSGIYKLIIQPEIAANSNFFISITKKPQYNFPVAGKSNGAIGSFWGMEREGGKRRHEGIDIFAHKGTPVVAVTDGIIGFTGERGIGGKQVWLRDGIFGKSLYCAHLDSINVQSGLRVKTGDTLGFVGNTGNAKFTPPHLHFGIYKATGAVNPLPYVYKAEQILPENYPADFKTTLLKVKSTANLRQGPSLNYSVLGRLNSNTTIILLGQHKEWLHIITPQGNKAFLHKSLVNNK